MSERRKRQDLANRDFRCLCGKEYLSYAAAYTHVKKKHESEREFLNAISRPQRLYLQRGRPPANQLAQVPLASKRRTIAEETILSLVQLMPEILLEGNAEGGMEESGEEGELVWLLNRHFTERMRAKTKETVEAMAKNRSLHELWREEKVRKVFQRCYERWRQLG